MQKTHEKLFFSIFFVQKCAHASLIVAIFGTFLAIKIEKNILSKIPEIKLLNLNNQIDNIQDLYYEVIKKLCTKHHAGLLPCKFAKSVMPEFYAVQLQNRVTRISLDQMYNCKILLCQQTHHSKQIVSKHGIICLLTIKLYHIPQTKKVYLNL